VTAMRVLVTGRDGQLARSLAERVQRHPGVALQAMGRPEFDLLIAGSAAKAIIKARPDIVIHAAAYTAVDQAEDEPEIAFRVNAAAAGEVAAAARQAGARLIHISTDYVFDGAAATPYREDAPTNPLGVYGRSKLAGEEQVRAAHPDHVIVRTAWVYSPFGRNFVKTMMGLAASRDSVQVVADQHGNPSSALDLADGLLAILGKWQAGGSEGRGRTYHLAGTGIASWFALARLLAEHGGTATRVEPIATTDWPTRAPRPAYSALDSGRFAADFGFRMPAWQESARATLARLRAET